MLRNTLKASGHPWLNLSQPHISVDILINKKNHWYFYKHKTHDFSHLNKHNLIFFVYLFIINFQTDSQFHKTKFLLVFYVTTNKHTENWFYFGCFLLYIKDEKLCYKEIVLFVCFSYLFYCCFISRKTFGKSNSIMDKITLKNWLLKHFASTLKEVLLFLVERISLKTNDIIL